MSVRLSVSTIARKVLERFSWNLVGRYGKNPFDSGVDIAQNGQLSAILDFSGDDQWFYIMQI